VRIVQSFVFSTYLRRHVLVSGCLHFVRFDLKLFEMHEIHESFLRVSLVAGSVVVVVIVQFAHFGRYLGIKRDWESIETGFLCARLENKDKQPSTASRNVTRAL